MPVKAGTEPGKSREPGIPSRHILWEADVKTVQLNRCPGPLSVLEVLGRLCHPCCGSVWCSKANINRGMSREESTDARVTISTRSGGKFRSSIGRLKGQDICIHHNRQAFSAQRPCGKKAYWGQGKVWLDRDSEPVGSLLMWLLYPVFLGWPTQIVVA